MTKEKLSSNLDHVIWNVEQARMMVSEHHIVKIVAVGKYSTIKDIEALYRLGQRAFGENQVQQLALRSDELADLPIEWHMIGTLQKNKINKLIELRPALFQSLDSFELAVALNEKLEVANTTMNCLLQINSANEDTKSGVKKGEAIDIYNKISKTCPNIKLKGVMCIGANNDNTDKVRESFVTTKEIFDKLDGATICSMGMSGDYELAIECGSNLVRIGSSIFDS
jgi:pyridoxal phosphate enzyme (YggS family)